jgi:membrane peptidoglycan carboxypeptidase
VQNALAQSSNTAFTDLAHTVGTANIADMAGQFGVNLAPYSEGGSGLKSYEGEVGMALGIAPLTVNEQTTMLATIADGGTYHQAHVIDYWQQGAAGAKQMPKVETHIVLTPAQDAQVQYAMEETTIDGTAAATVTYGQQSLGTVIGKTGTTTNSHSGFFIGSTTQYTLVVGMFTSSGDTNTNDNLAELGGGGFGGYWPAKIWNTIAESTFSPSPSLFTTTPAFSGATWNQVGAAATAKPTITCTVNGKKIKTTKKSCPVAPKPSPSPTCSYQGENQYDGCTTPTCNYPGESQNDGCVTASPSATAAPACTQGEDPNDGCATASAPASAAPTCTQGEDPNDGCTSAGTDSSGDTTTPTATAPAAASPTVSTSQAGLAVGDVVLPGSLLWTAIACRRRRRSRRRAGSAE